MQESFIQFGHVVSEKFVKSIVDIRTYRRKTDKDRSLSPTTQDHYL